MRAILKTIGGLVFASGLILSSHSAWAHCDTVDGPVAKAVRKALETGNVYLVLPYAPASAEKELRAAFTQARKVRALSPETRELADRSFLETAIRLHRAGEGAPYTGLKPAGLDFGPVIPAAEQAIESGDLSGLKAALMEEIEHALSERLAHVRETRKASKEPTASAGVPAARERVSAELGFVIFAESLRDAMHGKGAAHHAISSSADSDSCKPIGSGHQRWVRCWKQL
jgi:hypothetical protein